MNIKGVILIKRAMLVTWVKCQAILEHGDRNVNSYCALQNKTGLHLSLPKMSTQFELFLAYLEFRPGEGLFLIMLP